MPVERPSEGIKEVVRDLELLCIKEECTDMERAKELRKKKVAELMETNGTLKMVSSYWLIEVKHTYLMKTEVKHAYLMKTEDMQNYNFYIPSN